ncbi:LysM peptidoglycan-binding domain-containing protein [Longimicrobium sp.]|uniref:LysM peptidoglycan-binding domain-containing protein n=1 Tax=Longimicrobium sp. TaxID=2029185 RepID=UPI002E301DDC|nr:LysM peptidoglycan-binding domain-containing protein [Longimicrobium sp.]HEX6037096.1 LysM peptidoglycan-binding domain-containing protein [Longimicrobium sp.]
MHRKTIAGLFVLVSAAACGPGRAPVRTTPAPEPAPPVAPPAPPIEEITPIEQAAPTSTSAAPIGADLLGGAAYDLPMEANLSVRNELEFLVYQRHDVVGSWLRNAAPYHEFVREVFASYGVPRDLSHLGMIESGYRPTVRSHAGAVGMWQFMPATGRGMGLRIDSLVDERMDPVRSTHAAARHLRDLHRRFRGDWSLAAAAYNAGEGRINRGLGRFNASNFWDLANRGDLAQETRRYVPRLYATTIIAKDPVRFGFPAPGIVRRFAYDSVRVDLATPLSVLAQVGNLPVNELTEMNPHIYRQVAPRNYWVWVPAGQGGALQQAFAASEFRQRGGFGTYRVREGESLGQLATLSGLTTEQIRSLNLSANTDNLRAGTQLRLYADAARVLNARPVERVARGESRRSGPRVLGDTPENAGTSESASSTRESSERTSASSSERRSGSSTSSERNASSSERRSGSSESATSSRRSSSEGSSSRAGGERASSSASSERRSGSSTSERNASTERRGGSSESASSSTRRSSESGSSRASGEQPASSSSSSSSSSSTARRSEGSSSSARTHTVEDGETLWSIARRYETTVDAVREANDMGSETIRPGQTLRIPRASSATAGTARSESGTGRTATTARPESSGSRPSTPSSSRPSGERASASSSERSSSSSSAARSGSTSNGSQSGGTASRRREHTVGDGETLWGIARRYETTVDSLRRANDLSEGEQIQPGQKLTIPEN